MKTLLILFIKIYKFFLSPLLGNTCRFHPSCSSYSIDAINKHGAFYGVFQSIKRISKCNPWNSSFGYDPVE